MMISGGGHLGLGFDAFDEFFFPNRPFLGHKVQDPLFFKFAFKVILNFEIILPLEESLRDKGVLIVSVHDLRLFFGEEIEVRVLNQHLKSFFHEIVSVEDIRDSISQFLGDRILLNMFSPFKERNPSDPVIIVI